MFIQTNFFTHIYIYIYTYTYIHILIYIYIYIYNIYLCVCCVCVCVCECILFALNEKLKKGTSMLYDDAKVICKVVCGHFKLNVFCWLGAERCFILAPHSYNLTSWWWNPFSFASYFSIIFSNKNKISISVCFSIILGQDGFGKSDYKILNETHL